MSLRPFPDVPDDIVRLILEETVEGDYYSAFQLVLVAKHVQRWIDPLAYRVIKINSAKALSAICHTITSSIRPAKFFVDHVKILAIDVDDAEDINPLVAACPGIHSFASRRSRRLSPGLLDLHLNLRLLYLDILEYIYEQSMNAFDGLNIPLSRLTHLYVDALFYDTSYHRRLLELTPCLTHLCILCGLADPNIIDAVLRTGPKTLRVLIIRTDPSDLWEISRCWVLSQDPRCVFSILPRQIASSDTKDLVLSTEDTFWGRETDWGLRQDQQDMWKLAENAQENCRRALAAQV